MAQPDWEELSPRGSACSSKTVKLEATNGVYVSVLSGLIWKLASGDEENEESDQDEPGNRKCGILRSEEVLEVLHSNLVFKLPRLETPSLHWRGSGSSRVEWGGMGKGNDPLGRSGILFRKHLSLYIYLDHKGKGHLITNYYQYSLGVLALCVHSKRTDPEVIRKLLLAEHQGGFYHHQTLSVGKISSAQSFQVRVLLRPLGQI